MVVVTHLGGLPGLSPADLVRAEVAGDALTSELQEHVKRTIAPYKYPRAIEYVAQLPKTQTGKLQRFALRQIALGKSTSPGVAAE